MIDGYDWAGGREAMLRFGPTRGPVVVAAMPLLEEWNRTRAFVVALLRALAARGIAGALPDMPGHGESLVPLPDLGGLRAAMAAAVAQAGRVTLALSVRSGALLDGEAAHRARWHLSPVAGAELLRDLDRVRLASGGHGAVGAAATVVAGSELSAPFLRSIAAAELQAGARIVRLASDPRPADRHVEGVAPWRRAEPGNDPALVGTLGDDLAGWAATCVE